MKEKVHLITAVFFALFVIIVGLAFVILPDRDFSPEENRSLALFPEFTWERLADGSFSSEINDYFADQFPARGLFVGVKGIAETLMQRGENNGVLLGQDGQLAVRRFRIYKSRIEHADDMDYYSPDAVRMNLEGIAAWVQSSGIETVTVLPPRSVDVCSSAFSYPREISDALYADVSSLDPAAGPVDLLPLMRERYEAGEYVYLRTDHHWNGRGAYLAYREIMKRFGMEDEILPEDAFGYEQVPDFYGTTWSKSGLRFVGPDTLEIPLCGDEEDRFETVCLSERTVKGEDGKPKKSLEPYKSFDGWMNRDYLGEKDKYGALLDGTHNIQTVFSKTEERERLLVVKDSFANLLVPFLARHFDLVILNLSGGVTDASRFAEEFGTTRALIVYNWENLITGTYPGNLR